MESRLSSPFSALDWTGTPSTGRSVIAAAMPRILAASRSQAISIHLFADDGSSMQLIGQDGLSPEAQSGMQRTPLVGDFAEWAQADNVLRRREE